MAAPTSTRGAREIDLDIEIDPARVVLGPAGGPDVETLSGDALTRALVREVRRTNELLRVIALTTRYARGNYDGPYLTRKVVAVPATAPVEVFSQRGYPTALRIEWPAVAGGGASLLLSHDRAAMRRGDVVDLTVAGEIRVVVAAHQSMWAQGFNYPVAVTEVDVILKEARL